MKGYACRYIETGKEKKEVRQARGERRAKVVNRMLARNPHLGRRILKRRLKDKEEGGVGVDLVQLLFLFFQRSVALMNYVI